MKQLSDQRIFLLHIFVRDFFDSINVLGFAYLFIHGLPLWYLVVGIFLFRVSEPLLGLPLTRWLLRTYSYKYLACLGLLLEGVYIVVLFYSVSYHGLFIVALLLLCLWDTLYWPIRNNLERLTARQAIAHGVGYSHAVEVLAVSLGFVLAPRLLGDHLSVTLWLAILGVGLSAWFLTRLRYRLTCTTARSFWTLIWAFRKLPGHGAIAWSLGLSTILHELLTIVFPIVLARYGVQLKAIGLMLALIYMSSFLVNIYVSRLQNNQTLRRAVGVLGSSGVLIAGIFWFLPASFFPIFFILFAIVTRALLTVVYAKAQVFVQAHFPDMDGGYILEGFDMGSRSVLYPVIGLCFLLTPGVNLYQWLLVMSGIVILVLLQRLLSSLRHNRS